MVRRSSEAGGNRDAVKAERVRELHSRPIAILSGGPRSRWVYWEDELRAMVDAGLDYVCTDRKVTIGSVHYRLPAGRDELADAPANVWVFGPLARRAARGA